MSDQTGTDPRTANELVDELTTLVLAIHDHCERNDGRTNVPDLVAVALSQAAMQLGHSAELIRHRPGSWEAHYLQPLAALYDERPY